MSDNILISFPNTGRTWLQFMTKHLGVDCYYTHQGSQIRKQYPSGPQNSPSYTSVHVTRYTVPQIITYVERYPEKLTNKKLALLVRNPLDVMVSGYFQTIHRCGIPMSVHDFIRDPRHGISKLIAFNLYWREKYPCKVVTYEDLRTNTHNTLKQVCSYYGYECDDNAIAESIEKYKFDNMRKMELESMGFEKIFKNTTKDEPEAFKARRGVVGGYINYLTQEDIAYCEAQLKAHNYFERMQ